MNLLFVHQNFPGQYKHISRYFADQPGNRVVSLSQKGKPVLPGIHKVEYEPAREPGAETHHYLREYERCIIVGQSVVRAAMGLKEQGFRPDIIIGHNGWGEMFFLKDVWPDVPMLSYFEFFYRSRGSDMNFDPEYPSTANDIFRLRAKNSGNLLGLDAADWGQSPTLWQWRQYPACYRDRISVIHEGIDTDFLRPDPAAQAMLAPETGPLLKREDEIITFVSRNLEPYRGFHIFMRALPEILRRRPKARVLLVGGDSVSYGAKLPPGESYKQRMLDEVGDKLDMSRVHFLGQIPYAAFIRMLQLSSVHVYLTYPFVLSWSMLEAMSCGACVVGSATPPVMEVLEHEKNGLLVDFFDVDGIVDAVDRVLDHPDRMQHLRDEARRTVVERYDLKTVCLPRHVRLITDLVEGRTPGEVPTKASAPVPVVGRAEGAVSLPTAQELAAVKMRKVLEAKQRKQAARGGRKVKRG